MIVCDRCGRGGDVHMYSFGQTATTTFSGLISRDLCPNCAQAFAKLFEEFTNTPNEANHYGTQEWQDKLKAYETECRKRSKQ